MNLKDSFAIAIEEASKSKKPMIVCTAGEVAAHFNNMVRSQQGFNRPDMAVTIIRGMLVVGPVTEMQRAAISGRISGEDDE